MKVLKIWKEHGPGSTGCWKSPRASKRVLVWLELHFGEIFSDCIVQGSSLRDRTRLQAKSAGKLLVELGTAGLRKATHNQRHRMWEEVGPNLVVSAPETLAGGREVGEGRLPFGQI